MIKDPFDSIYSSREGERAGVGYPSCNRALMKLPPQKRNLNDSNGYYEFLGVPTWAEIAHIKTRLRQNFRKYHPDGSKPDPKLFAKTKMISEVLLDPKRKKRYDDTREDQVFMDPELMEELKDDPDFQRKLKEKGVTMMEVFKNEFGEENDTPDTDDIFFHKEMGETTSIPWDYFSDIPVFDGDQEDSFIDRIEVYKMDEDLARSWYESFLSVAPIFSFTSTIKVLLHQGEPGYISGANIVMIPRSWPASTANAFGIFSVLISPSFSPS